MSFSIRSSTPAAPDVLEYPYMYAWAGVALIVGLVVFTAKQRNPPFGKIPAIGSTGVFSSYFSAWEFVKNARFMVQDGYHKYKSTVFRIPEFNRWHVMISDATLIDEMRRAPDDTLSMKEASRESLAADYILGRNVVENLYHVDIVRNQLTRNLGRLFSDVYDEIAQAFDDNIPATNDWTKVKVFDGVQQVVARTSNRLFVGLPTCRDPEFTALNIQFARDCIAGGQIISLFPKPLKPLAANFLTNVPKAINTGLRHLKPLIDERQHKIDEYGLDYPDKPNDMISWLMDEAKGEERSAKNLTLRILALNFAAIHTSSMSFTHALYNLVSLPQYIEPLRKEIETVIAEEGWSKMAMSRMRKLDSFLKESQRVTGLGAVSMQRIAMRSFTFSDGTRVPKGALISATTMRHGDEEVYVRAEEFDGFRFSDMREEEGESTKNQFVATSPDYITFGHGRHACPGRFFAANELKAMMAHLLLTYDVKLEQEGVRPPNEYFGVACIPNRKAELLFRKRQN